MGSVRVAMSVASHAIRSQKPQLENRSQRGGLRRPPRDRAPTGQRRAAGWIQPTGSTGSWPSARDVAGMGLVLAGQPVTLAHFTALDRPIVERGGGGRERRADCKAPRRSKRRNGNEAPTTRSTPGLQIASASRASTGTRVQTLQGLAWRAQVASSMLMELSIALSMRIGPFYRSIPASARYNGQHETSLPIAPSVEPEVSRPDAGKLISGDPVHTTWNLEERDGLYCGIWQSTPGKWSIAYDEWEYCRIPRRRVGDLGGRRRRCDGEGRRQFHPQARLQGKLGSP